MTVYYSEYTPPSTGSGIEGRSLIDLTSTSFADLFAQAGAYSSVTVYSKGMLAYDQNSIWVYINASSSFGNSPPTLPTISNAYWELVGTTSTNTFVWIAYANSSDGTTFTDFTVGDSGAGGITRRWIGFASNKTSAVESTNPADYQWTRFVGTDGILGADGISGGLTNPAIQVYAYANGNVVSYTGATGQFRVDKGALDISSNFTLSSVSNPQGLSVTYTGQTYTITNGLDVNEDVGSLTIRATGSGTYSGITLERTLSISKIKGGFEILPILTANTDSTNFDGRIVYNKADAKLYRYTGTPGSGGGWTSAVPAADIAGELIESQIANAAIGPSKLKMGVGGNMLSGAVPGTNPNKYFKVGWNPDSVDFFNTGDGGPILSPVFGTGFPDNYNSWTTPDGGTFAAYQSNNSPNSTQGAGITDFHFMYPNDTNTSTTIWFPVEEDKTYEFSAYTGAHRCSVLLLIVWYDSSGAQLGDTQSPANSSIEGGGTSLDGYLRLTARGAAPVGATKAVLVARKGHTTVGQSSSWMFLNRPMWAETVANATETLPYNPPPQGLIDAEVIRSNSILTRHLKADTIEAQHLKANIVSAKHLFIGDNENLLANGNLNTGNLDGWSRRIINNAGNILEVRTDTIWPARYGLFMRRNSGNGELSIVAHSSNWDDAMAQGVTLRPGEELYFECVSWTSSTSTSGLADVVIKHPNGSVTQITPIALSNTYPSGGYLGWNPGPYFTTIKGVFKNNTSNTGTAFLRLLHDFNAAAGSEIYVWNTLLRKRAAGELIVDGAITAGKIFSGAVTTDKIDAGAVNAAKLATTELITLSAQIKNGIITTAKIEDLAVSTAKIDNLSVDTIKIAGNAVTVGVSAFSAGEVTLPMSGEWQDIQSIVISTDGSPIIILAQASIFGDGGPATSVPRILRNGSEIRLGTNRSGNDFVASDAILMIADTPSAGTHTYTLQAAYTSGIYAGIATNRFLFALNTKR